MTATLTRLLHRLRRLTAPPSADSDAELLGRYARRRDQEAFEALMARHGSMVLNVCRRVLGDAHAAEDAAQATFLVLARKAGSLGRPAALAGWLYGVASRVARKARAAARRRECQGLAGAAEALDPRAGPPSRLAAREFLAAVEEELRRLPESQRLAVSLCCLEGLSQEDAARRLGWTPGAIRGRLERGRRRLHERLARRGLTPSAAFAAVAESRGLASAGWAMRVMRTGPAGTSRQAVLLAHEVLKEMFMGKLMVVTTTALAMVLAASGAGVLTYWAVAAAPAPAPRRQEAPVADEMPPAAADRPTRDLLEGRLREVLKDACPDAKLEWSDEGNLVVRYKTRPFQVHGAYMTGEYAEKTHEEEGPHRQGFLLHVRVGKGPDVGQLALPQTLREPYWQTYIDKSEGHKGEYLLLRLSYGSRTDEKLLDRLKRAVAAAAREGGGGGPRP